MNDQSTSAPSASKNSMNLAEHLLELRRRVVHSLIAIGLAFAVIFPFARELYDLLAQPILRFMPEGGGIIATEVAAPFLIPIMLTFYAALFVTMPYLLLQIWRFIAPGLYRGEKKIALPLLLSSIALFYAGATFAWFVVLPGVFEFLLKFAPDTVTPMTDMNHYLSFVTKLLLVFGFTFEIPVAVLILVLSGVVSVAALKDKRRYVIVGCFFIAAVVTPPDGVSMLLLAIPMWLLYEAGILIASLLKTPIKLE